jgi:hypothetical protein
MAEACQTRIDEWSRLRLGKNYWRSKRAGPARGLVAAVIYALPRRVFFVGEDTKPIQSMTQPTFIESPYVYKEIGYNFEQEIRFVLGVNPDLSWQKPNLPGIIKSIGQHADLEPLRRTSKINASDFVIIYPLINQIRRIHRTTGLQMVFRLGCGSDNSKSERWYIRAQSSSKRA